MIKTILLYDNKDATLGMFFELCADKFRHLHNVIYKQDISTEHNSDNCKKTTIESVLSAYNSSNFLFVSFLHGSEDAMYVSSEEIVSANNAHFFKNAFCYTFSCYCGKKLSNILLKNDVGVFWGYKDKAYSCHGYEDDFAELAVLGLTHFLQEDSIDSAFIKAKEAYTKKADDLYKDNMLVAAYLLHNRDSMIIEGNKYMTVSDFTIK
ncbi:MAG: hypothetical protein FWC10_07590 [Lentimicrobiaceae bacterium]|nr:hypothetical protein [Lentimicrobiaceae bacterium]